MMKLNVQVLDTADQSVKVTIVARGYYGTPSFEDVLTQTMNYGEGFSLEELISSASIDIAFKYMEKYKAKCWIEKVTVEKEDY